MKRLRSVARNLLVGITATVMVIATGHLVSYVIG